MIDPEKDPEIEGIMISFVLGLLCVEARHCVLIFQVCQTFESPLVRTRELHDLTLHVIPSTAETKWATGRRAFSSLDLIPATRFESEHPA